MMAGPVDWTLLAPLAAVLAVAAGLATHVIRYAYKQGEMETRLKAVERAVEPVMGLREDIAGLQSTISHLVERLDRFEFGARRRSTRQANEAET